MWFIISYPNQFYNTASALLLQCPSNVKFGRHNQALTLGKDMTISKHQFSLQCGVNDPFNLSYEDLIPTNPSLSIKDFNGKTTVLNNQLLSPANEYVRIRQCENKLSIGKNGCLFALIHVSIVIVFDTNSFSEPSISQLSHLAMELGVKLLKDKWDPQCTHVLVDPYFESLSPLQVLCMCYNSTPVTLEWLKSISNQNYSIPIVIQKDESNSASIMLKWFPTVPSDTFAFSVPNPNIYFDEHQNLVISIHASLLSGNHSLQSYNIKALKELIVKIGASCAFSVKTLGLQVVSLVSDAVELPNLKSCTLSAFLDAVLNNIPLSTVFSLSETNSMSSSQVPIPPLLGLLTDEDHASAYNRQSQSLTVPSCGPASTSSKSLFEHSASSLVSSSKSLLFGNFDGLPNTRSKVISGKIQSQTPTQFLNSNQTPGKEPLIGVHSQVIHNSHVPIKSFTNLVGQRGSLDELGFASSESPYTSDIVAQSEPVHSTDPKTFNHPFEFESEHVVLPKPTSENSLLPPANATKSINGLADPGLEMNIQRTSLSEMQMQRCLVPLVYSSNVVFETKDDQSNVKKFRKQKSTNHSVTLALCLPPNKLPGQNESGHYNGTYDSSSNHQAMFEDGFD